MIISSAAVVAAAVIDLNLTSIRPIDPTTWVEGNLSATLAVRPPLMNFCGAEGIFSEVGRFDGLVV